MTYIFDPDRYAGMPLGIVHREIGDQIERMIEYLDGLDPWDEREEENEHGAVLDAMEGDGLENGEGDECDHECDGRADDEPSLGWTGQICQIGSGFHGGASTLEHQVDLEEDLSDKEPWLGWTTSGHVGNITDCEENGDEQDGDAFGSSEDMPIFPDAHREAISGNEIASAMLRDAGLKKRHRPSTVTLVSSSGERAALRVTL